MAYPSVETFVRDAIAIGDFGNGMIAIRELLESLDLEIVRVTRAAHDTSYCCLSLGLRGVYQSRGDSFRPKQSAIGEFARWAAILRGSVTVCA
jgi:hypothetical protein